MSLATNRNRDFFICCNEGNLSKVCALLRQFPGDINPSFDENKCLKWAAYDEREHVIRFLLLQSSVVRQDARNVMGFCFLYRYSCAATLILTACGFRTKVRCCGFTASFHQARLLKLFYIKNRSLLAKAIELTNVQQVAFTLLTSLAQLDLPVLLQVHLLSSCCEPFDNLLPWHIIWRAMDK